MNCRICAVIGALSILLSFVPVWGDLQLMQTSDHVEFSNDQQKLIFVNIFKDAHVKTQRFSLKTFVRNKDGWVPMFDAGLPLVLGSAFGDLPNNYEITE